MPFAISAGGCRSAFTSAPYLGRRRPDPCALSPARTGAAGAIGVRRRSAERRQALNSDRSLLHTCLGDRDGAEGKFDHRRRSRSSGAISKILGWQGAAGQRQSPDRAYEGSCRVSRPRSGAEMIWLVRRRVACCWSSPASRSPTRSRRLRWLSFIATDNTRYSRSAAEFFQPDRRLRADGDARCSSSPARL